MGYFTVIIALALCSLPVFATNADRGNNRFALLIGIDDYQPSGLPALRGAVRDIQRINQVLRTHYQFKPTHIQQLLNAQATHSHIKNAFVALADAIAPGDHVYIHFSGYGSLSTDLNGDEPATHMDRTWVPYGARQNSDIINQSDTINHSDTINQFDILDDEISRWLTPIYAKTQHVVLVSDASHHARTLRGRSAPGVRAAIIDRRMHPLGIKPTATVDHPGVFLRAADHLAHAGEFQSTDGAQYGFFTWSLTQELAQANPDDTWADVFQRVSERIHAAWGQSQRPTISGHLQQPLFPRHNTVQATALTEIPGPVKFFLNADFPDTVDRPLLQTLAAALAEEPDMQQVKDQAQADFVLYILRPNRQHGLTLYTEQDAQAATASLPRSNRNSPPEVWLLNPLEALYQPRLMFPLPNTTSALTTLQNRLRQLAHANMLTRLNHQQAQQPVEMEVIRLTPAPQCDATQDQCVFLSGLPHGFHLHAPENSRKMDGLRVDAGEIFTFQLRNTTQTAYYCYIVNISPDHQISVIFPTASSAAKLEPLAQRTLTGAGLMFSNKGEEQIKLIVSQHPIDPQRLQPEHSGPALTALFKPLPHPSAPNVPPLWSTVQFRVHVATQSRPIPFTPGIARGEYTLPGASGEYALHTTTRSGDNALTQSNNKYVSVKVFFATNRAQEENPELGVAQFNNHRGKLQFGELWVSIPPNHAPGKLEEPSIFQFEIDNDPNRHVVLLKLNLLDKAAFLASMNSNIAASKSKNLLVYIHGYNNSFSEAARRTAQIAYDMDKEGFSYIPVLFSWPSGNSVSPLEYAKAWTNKEWSRNDLAQLLISMADQTQADNIYLLAHSMGTNLLGATMEKVIKDRKDTNKPLFKEIILAAPDIDTDIFQRDIAPLLRRVAERTTLYAADADLALQISKEFHAGYPRIGDSSSGITVIQHMDTIDVSKINTSDIGHGYYSQIKRVLTDIAGILKGIQPKQRLLTQEVTMQKKTYWSLPTESE